MKGEKVEEMHPWYAGFNGSVQHTPKGYEITGKIANTGPKTIEISELPIKVWTQDYKSFLQEMLAGNQVQEKPKAGEEAAEKAFCDEEMAKTTSKDRKSTRLNSSHR